MKAVRRATHAGSWYEDDEARLDGQLTEWLQSVQTSEICHPPASVIDVGTEGWSQSSDTVSLPVAGCKAVIAPHAGYSYSGPAAAYAYRCIDPAKYKRIFILGPSHKVYLDGCALSACKEYDTPLGELPLDLDTIDELRNTGKFLNNMSKSVDEDEHSIEMHLPYIRKVFEHHDISIVPILVGSTSAAQEHSMGKLLAPYLADEKTLFVVSSDFCHWGSRFSYTYYKPDLSAKASSLGPRDAMSSKAPIHSSIRALDGTAISHLTFPASIPLPDASKEPSDASSTPSASDDARTAKQALDEFNKYLRDTKNTICGRHPIAVLLATLAALEVEGTKSELRFTRYEQSSQCLTVRDSSVSYASAFVRLL